MPQLSHNLEGTPDATAVTTGSGGNSNTAGNNYFDLAPRNTGGTPSTGSLRVQKPDGTETTYAFGSLSNPSTGRMEKTIRVDQDGRWYANFTMTVAGTQIVDEFSFQVRASQFGA